MQMCGTRIMLASLLIASTIVSLQVFGQEKGSPSMPKQSVINFGLSRAVIDGDVNREDALAAAKVWATIIGTGEGLWNRTDARLYENLADIVTDVNSGKLDLVSMSTQEYLELESRIAAKPLFTLIQGGHCEVEYLILVRLDTGIQALRDLQNKRVTFLTRGGRNSLSPLWSEVMLAENGFPDRDTFFSEVREVTKSSQAVLSVFFRQSDAAVVPRSVFETAAALNPQVGRQLRILIASPRFVHTVVCVRSSLPSETKNAYLNLALKLHETARGLQNLTVFKIDRAVAWQPMFYDGVRDLLKKHRTLKSGKLAQHRASSPD